jgi:hypothetical protein
VSSYFALRNEVGSNEGNFVTSVKTLTQFNTLISNNPIYFKVNIECFLDINSVSSINSYDIVGTVTPLPVTLTTKITNPAHKEEVYLPLLTDTNDETISLTATVSGAPSLIQNFT